MARKPITDDEMYYRVRAERDAARVAARAAELRARVAMEEAERLRAQLAEETDS